MCSNWNISQDCSNSPFELTTYTNLSKALLLGHCLDFPVQSLEYGDSSVPHPLCTEKELLNCSVSCDNLAVMSYIQKPVGEEVPFYQTLQFQILFGLMIGSWIGQAVVVSLGDSICFSLLGKISMSIQMACQL